MMENAWISQRFFFRRRYRYSRGYYYQQDDDDDDNRRQGEDHLPLVKHDKNNTTESKRRWLERLLCLKDEDPLDIVAADTSSLEDSKEVLPAQRKFWNCCKAANDDVVEVRMIPPEDSATPCASPKKEDHLTQLKKLDAPYPSDEEEDLAAQFVPSFGDIPMEEDTVYSFEATFSPKVWSNESVMSERVPPPPSPTLEEEEDDGSLQPMMELSLRDEGSLDSSSRLELSLGSSRRTEYTLGSSRRTDRSIDSSRLTKQTIDSSIRTDNTFDFSRRTDESVDSSRRMDQSVDSSYRTGLSLDTSRRTELSLDSSRRTELSLDSSRRTDPSRDSSHEDNPSVDAQDELDLSLLSVEQKKRLADHEKKVAKVVREAFDLVREIERKEWALAQQRASDSDSEEDLNPFRVMREPSSPRPLHPSPQLCPSTDPSLHSLDSLEHTYWDPDGDSAAGVPLQPSWLDHVGFLKTKVHSMAS